MKPVFTTLGFGIIPMLCIVALVGCSDNKKNNAPDRNFYFEVVAPKPVGSSAELAVYLQEQIPKKKYTITNHSGMEWPFYKELDIDESILSDSLMPPHWFVHKMVPFKQDSEIKPGEFLVKIYINPQADTLLNFDVKIFRKDSIDLKLSGQSGIHYLDSTEFTPQNSLVEVYLKSIIRYSFK